MDNLIKSVCDELKKDQQLVGIILYGSFAEGNNHPQSDIDLIAIYEYDIDRVRCFIEEGTSIQILERSLDIFKTKLIKSMRKKPYSLSAKIQYDKTGEINDLIQKAKELEIARGPHRLSDKDILYGRITLSQDIYTIEGLIANEQLEAATLIVMEVLLVALDLYYDYYHYFKVGPKRLIEDLKSYDESLAEATSLVLLSDDIKAKLVNLWIIRNQVLDLLGGEILEYEMEF